MSLHCIVWCCMVLYCWLRRAGCISQDTYLLYNYLCKFTKWSPSSCNDFENIIYTGINAQNLYIYIIYIGINANATDTWRTNERTNEKGRWGYSAFDLCNPEICNWLPADPDARKGKWKRVSNSEGNTVASYQVRRVGGGSSGRQWVRKEMYRYLWISCFQMC